MSEASLGPQRNLSDSQEAVQTDMDKSGSQSEGCTDDTHMTEIHINDGSSAKNLSRERNGADAEGYQDAVMHNCSSNDRVHTVAEPRSTNPETSQSFKVILSTASVSALFCSKLL